MKYSLGFSQKALIDSGLNEAPYKLDAIDMLLLDYVAYYTNFCEKIQYNNHTYFWIANAKIVKDCPVIIKTEAAAKKRMIKLCKAHVLMKHPDCATLKRSYYKIGENFKKLAFNEDGEQVKVAPVKIVTGEKSTRENCNEIANKEPVTSEICNGSANTRENCNGLPDKSVTATRENCNGDNTIIDTSISNNTISIPSTKVAASENPKQLEMELVEEKVSKKRRNSSNEDLRKKCIGRYNSFHIEITGMKMDWNTNKGEGKAMNMLISKLINAVKSSEKNGNEISDEAYNLFDIMLTHWNDKDKSGNFILNNFFRQNILVRSINSQFPNILGIINEHLTKVQNETSDPLQALYNKAKRW